MNAPPAAASVQFYSAGIGVRLDGLTPELSRLVRHAGAGMVGEPPSRNDGVVLTVMHRPDGSTSLDGSALSQDPLAAAATLIAAVDRAMLGRTPTVCVHAAVVAGAGGAAVLPGRSGSGKSTLTAACLRAGLSLVSDEAACVDSDSLALFPHPRPLGLSQDSRRLLHLDRAEQVAEEVAISPSSLGPVISTTVRVPIALVATLDRHTGASAHLAAAARSDALLVLVANRLEVGDSRRWSGEAGWRVLSRVASSVTVGTLTFDDPDDAADLLLERLGGPVPPLDQGRWPATWAKNASAASSPPTG